MSIGRIGANNTDYKFAGQSMNARTTKKPTELPYDQRDDNRRFDGFSAEETIQKFGNYNDKAVNKNAARGENASAARYVKKTTYIIADDESVKPAGKNIPPQISALRQLTASAGGYTLCRTNGDDGFSYSIKSGKKSVITIDSRFLEAIADSPELIKHYANEIENMRRLDKQFERQAKRAGKAVVSRGWHIDKDGGISSWSVVKTERKAKKSHLQQMNEYRQKINKKKRKKQKEQQKIDDRRSKRKEELLRLEGRKKAAMKEKLGRKAKKAKLYEFNEIIIKRPPQTIKSISISSGYTPPIADLGKLDVKA